MKIALGQTAFLFLGVFMVLTLIGCNDSEIKVNDDSKVLASVSGSNITERDLEFHVNTHFKQADALLADEKARRQVLESLVASRAMAQLADKELSDDEMERIIRQAKALIEEEKVKAYLKLHAEARPVTSEMVKAYYESHPEKFGGSEKKTIEWISVVQNGETESRDAFLRQSAQFNEKADWERLSKQVKPSVQYKRLEVNQAVLETKMKEALANLKAGQVSNVIMGERNISKIKLLKVEDQPAKPLSEVSNEIRMMLAPVQLKQEVARISGEALKQVKVSYKD